MKGDGVTAVHGTDPGQSSLEKTLGPTYRCSKQQSYQGHICPSGCISHFWTNAFHSFLEKARCSLGNMILHYPAPCVFIYICVQNTVKSESLPAISLYTHFAQVQITTSGRGRGESRPHVSWVHLWGTGNGQHWATTQRPKIERRIASGVGVMNDHSREICWSKRKSVLLGSLQINACKFCTYNLLFVLFFYHWYRKLKHAYTQVLWQKMLHMKELSLREKEPQIKKNNYFLKPQSQCLLCENWNELVFILPYAE